MAAGTGIVTPSISVVRNTAIDVSVSQMTAATNSGTLVTDTDFFIITPTKDDKSLVILVNNGTGASITAVLQNGEMWASTGVSATATIATGKTFAWTLDTAKFKTKTGKINVLLTPTAGTALSASAKANVTCLSIA